MRFSVFPRTISNEASTCLTVGQPLPYPREAYQAHNAIRTPRYLQVASAEQLAHLRHLEGVRAKMHLRLGSSLTSAAGRPYSRQTMARVKPSQSDGSGGRRSGSRQKHLAQAACRQGQGQTWKSIAGMSRHPTDTERPSKACRGTTDAPKKTRMGRSGMCPAYAVGARCVLSIM